MSSYNHKDDELVISEFFEELMKALNYHNQTVRQFFEVETEKINILAFKAKLKKLGYNGDKTEEVNKITNKFLNRMNPNIVDLVLLENELKSYNRNSMTDTFSNIPMFPNIGEKIEKSNMTNSQNLNDNNFTNSNMNNNQYNTNNFGNINNQYNTNNFGNSNNQYNTNNFGNSNNQYNTNNFGNSNNQYK